MSSQEAAKIRHKLRDSVKRKVRFRDRNKCVRCGSPEELTFHHVIPISNFLYGEAEGKVNCDENIVLLCQRCHIKIHRKADCERNTFLEYIHRRHLKLAKIKQNEIESLRAQEKKINALKQIYADTLQRINSMRWLSEDSYPRTS